MNIKELRQKTNYPAARAVISFATVITHLIAALLLIAGLVNGNFYLLASGAITILVAKVSKEVASAVFDIADASAEMLR